MKKILDHKKINEALLLTVLVGLFSFFSYFIVGYPLIWIFGLDNVKTPVFTAIYSALAYCFTLSVLMFLPNLLKKVYSRLPKIQTFFEKHPIFFQNSKKDLGLLGLPTFTDISLAIIGFVTYWVLAAIITFIFSLFPWFQISEVQNVGFSNLLVGSDRVIAFIALVILAPLAEEIIFRGWLYGKLRKNQNIFLSIFLTSLVFGLLHGQWNVGVNVFALSVVMCLCREFTDSIYAGIFLHMLKNGIAFYFLYFVGFQ